MNRLLARTKITVLLLGIAETVLGIICLTNPATATVTVAMMVGWVLIFLGAGTLCACLMRDDGGRFDLVVGGLELALGTLMVIRPAFFVSYLFVLLGILVVITGLTDLVDAGRYRSDGSQINTGMAVATIVVGAVMLAAPFFFADMIAIIAGIALVVSGVTEVAAGIRMP